MQQEELRTVLLVKAIEEADRAGTLVPQADRVAATREAQRAEGEASENGEATPPGRLSEAVQRMGVARAKTLLGKVVSRHPFVATVRELSGGPGWASAILFALGLLLGFAFSSLDGTRRINVLAFALIGVLLWNLAAYVVVVASWLPVRAGPRAPRLLPGLLARAGTLQVSRLVAKSGAFNALLAEGLSRFVREWSEVARPLLVTRATRALHLSAAAVGIGLIAGLYVRGIAFDYQAGWESTFFGAPQVRTALSIVYGPASWITGVSIPDVAHLEGIRWKDGAGGERAAPWIHLLAATIALFVVLPRSALALFASLSIARWSRSMPLPPALVAYFRTAFGAEGGALGPGLATVVPYAYEPSTAARAGLRALLPPAVGSGVTLDMRSPVRYGEEEEFLRSLDEAGEPDLVVLLFNLAATPEAENHGAVIAGVREWLGASWPHAQLLVLVDEGPYAARMAADGGADARVAERRGAWKDFAATHALGVCSVDLAAAERADAPSQALVDSVRGALRQASAT